MYEEELAFAHHLADRAGELALSYFRHDPQVTWKKNNEGTLHWVPTNEILSLNLWPGDSEFIPMVLEGRPFIGTFWYRDGLVTRHWLQRLHPLDTATA